MADVEGWQLDETVNEDVPRHFALTARSNLVRSSTVGHDQLLQRRALLLERN